MMVPTSLRPYVPLVGITGGFTARHYTRLVTDSYYLEIIGRTLALGLTVTCATLVIGYPVAFFLARTRSRGRNWLTILVVFPLMLNLVVRTFGWIALLAQNGLVNQALQALGVVDGPVKLLFNFVGVFIGLTHIFLPFMVLVLIGAIQNIPRDVEDAARDVLDGADEHEHHERQEDVGQADEDTGKVEEQLHRRIHHPQRLQRLVHQPVLGEQGL